MRRLADLLLLFLAFGSILLFLGAIQAVDNANSESDRLRARLAEESERADKAKTEALFWRGMVAKLGASPAPSPLPSVPPTPRRVR